MKKILLIAAMLAVIVVAFFGKTKTTRPQGPLTAMAATIDSHTSQNSLDWYGIYRGVLPCADCQGIQKTIYLNKDLSYLAKTKYLGKDDSARESKGKFMWNDQGNTITLNESGQEVKYFVGESTLMQLDMNGNRITGELAGKYILSKEKYALLERYWKLTELMGKPVKVDSTFPKEPHIIFKDESGKFIGNGGCNNFSGTYQQGDMNRIKLAQAISTLMACPAMEIESQFLKVLATADNYNVVGDNLVLNKARMSPLARFKSVVMQ